MWDEGVGNSAIVYEFAASTFIIGDVRDILKYGGKWYFGLADDTEKLVTSLAAVGILTTVTPVADLVVTSLKIVIKKAANTPAANAVAEIGRKVVDEVVSGSFATLDKFGDIFRRLSTSDLAKTFFERGIVRNADDLDILNSFYKSYGDNAEAIITRLYTKMDGALANEVAEKQVRDLIKGLVDINTVIGKELSDDGIDGLAALMKVDGINSARLGNMARFLSPPKDLELESALKAAKGIDELAIKPDGFEKVFKEFANERDPITDPFAKNKTRGALHVLREVGSTTFGGVANVAKFEEITRPLGPNTKKRIIDVITKGFDASGSPKRLEFKSWEQNVPRWNKNSAELEFVFDILSRDPPPDFEWVIKGTDLDKVRDVMLQTLGELPKSGKKNLHPALKEALDSGLLSETKFNDIVTKVKNLTILRKESY